MNSTASVNTFHPAALQRAVAGKLTELLREISWLPSPLFEPPPKNRRSAHNLAVTLKPPGGPIHLYVECKADPRPASFLQGDLWLRLPTENDRTAWILAAPRISPRMAELCQTHGWSWLDLAGNCRIDVPGALYLERTGRPPMPSPRKESANLGTPEAGRVVRALLAPENAGRHWTQRHLETHFGESSPVVTKPSLALVNKVVQHLRDEAFLEMFAGGGFRLRDPLGLLRAWREAYRFDRHERRGFFTLKQGPVLRDALASLESLTGGYAAYAAFSAADFQAPHVRQPKTWLFLGAEHEDAFQAAVEAKPVDSGENLVVLTPADNGVFYLEDTHARRLASTNPVQTYVDLCHCGGRGEEAAEALLEQKLKPEWKVRGIL